MDDFMAARKAQDRMRAERDARRALEAAAPELLAAAREVSDAAGQMDAHSDTPMVRAVANLRAAMAKSEGR